MTTTGSSYTIRRLLSHLLTEVTPQTSRLSSTKIRTDGRRSSTWTTNHPGPKLSTETTIYLDDRTTNYHRTSTIDRDDHQRRTALPRTYRNSRDSESKVLRHRQCAQDPSSKSTTPRHRKSSALSEHYCVIRQNL